MNAWGKLASHKPLYLVPDINGGEVLIQLSERGSWEEQKLKSFKKHTEKDIAQLVSCSRILTFGKSCTGNQFSRTLLTATTQWKESKVFHLNLQVKISLFDRWQNSVQYPILFR